jgi:excisionase family DNA binding protein
MGSRPSRRDGERTGVVKSEPVMIDVPGDGERFIKLVTRGLLVVSAHALHQIAGGSLQPPLPPPDANEVMTADEVAAFLGVDRNTVYDYAGRGVIPHQRLGKRILFRRAALLSWLDSCNATSTRKG